MSNKVYRATLVIDVVGLEDWANHVHYVTEKTMRANGYTKEVTSVGIHIARNEKELEGILRSSFKGHLVSASFEYLRDEHPQDSEFSNLYPCFSRYLVETKDNHTYYIEDRKEKKFLFADIKEVNGKEKITGLLDSRFEAVNKLIEIEKGT